MERHQYQQLLMAEKSHHDENVINQENSQSSGRISVHIVCFICSLVLNLALLVFICREHFIKAQRPEVKTPLDYFSTRSSPYSGLHHDTQIPYAHDTDWNGENRTLADLMWSKLDNVFAIAVSEEWAREKNLPHTWKFPWDQDKRLYYPKVGHQLHCLKSMRASYHELWERNSTRIARGHIEHCLDSLRQDLMCQADDTPMPALKPLNSLGDDQLMQCKNFDKLREWVYAPERNACYRNINMYNGVRHPIERFAFCDEDSIYYPVMKKYFEVHGHQDVIEDMG